MRFAFGKKLAFAAAAAVLLPVMSASGAFAARPAQHAQALAVQFAFAVAEQLFEEMVAAHNIAVHGIERFSYRCRALPTVLEHMAALLVACVARPH